ncbi:MAG: NAD(P)/FAD-dependent oxidoreductase [Candidatus Bipolaricaulia bacterium]
MSRVVIIGAGFGGLSCARALVNKPIDVLLLDKNNYHLFTPLLYQVASSLLDPSDIAYPVRAVFRRAKNVRFQMATVTEIDLHARLIKTNDGALIPYDYVVIATGSVTNYFGMDTVAQAAYELKDIPEALELRNHILRCFEAAAREAHEPLRRRWLTFVIVGAGPNGVEYAGALSELIRLVLVRDFPELDMKSVRIVLVEALGRVLPAFAPKLGQYAQWQLERRGIEVRLNTRVLDVSGDTVRLSSGETIETKTLIWAAGVKASELATVPSLARTRAGRIEVDQFLRAKGHERVFVIGDLAAFIQDGKELPMLARPAMQAGAHVAENIVRLERHQPLMPFRYRDPGIMATIGRNSAVAQLKSISLTGFIGWLAWLVLHLMLLIGFRNRFAVLLNWAWEYIFYDRPVRLIARAREHP